MQITNVKWELAYVSWDLIVVKLLDVGGDLFLELNPFRLLVLGQTAVSQVRGSTCRATLSSCTHATEVVAEFAQKGSAVVVDDEQSERHCGRCAVWIEVPEESVKIQPRGTAGMFICKGQPGNDGAATEEVRANSR